MTKSAAKYVGVLDESSRGPGEGTSLRDFRPYLVKEHRKASLATLCVIINDIHDERSERACCSVVVDVFEESVTRFFVYLTAKMWGWTLKGCHRTR